MPLAPSRGKARGAAKHLTQHRGGPTTKHYLAENVIRAKARKPQVSENLPTPLQSPLETHAHTHPCMHTHAHMCTHSEGGFGCLAVFPYLRLPAAALLTKAEQGLFGRSVKSLGGVWTTVRRLLL